MIPLQLATGSGQSTIERGQCPRRIKEGAPEPPAKGGEVRHVLPRSPLPALPEATEAVHRLGVDLLPRSMERPSEILERMATRRCGATLLSRPSRSCTHFVEGARKRRRLPAELHNARVPATRSWPRGRVAPRLGAGVIGPSLRLKKRRHIGAELEPRHRGCDWIAGAIRTPSGCAGLLRGVAARGRCAGSLRGVPHLLARRPEDFSLLVHFRQRKCAHDLLGVRGATRLVGSERAAEVSSTLVLTALAAHPSAEHRVVA